MVAETHMDKYRDGRNEDRSVEGLQEADTEVTWGGGGGGGGGRQEGQPID